MELRKSKAQLTIPDYESLPKEGGDKWLVAADDWLQQLSIITEPKINTLIFYIQVCNSGVRKLEFSASNELKHIHFTLYVNLRTVLFSKKRKQVISNIREALLNILGPSWKFSAVFKWYRKGRDDEKDSTI